MIDMKKVYDFKNRALNLGKEITRGTSQTSDVYFQNTEIRNKYYDEFPDIVNDYMQKINKIFCNIFDFPAVCIAEGDLEI